MNILLHPARTESVVKNSRFIAEVFPVASQAQAREKLHGQKALYKDATHVVHAFVTGLQGETSGMSDDGEPSGTAGRPVLDVLRGSNITNILLTVTRYFGGTLLGTGGLVRAYGDAAKQVLAACASEPYREKRRFSFSTDYGLYGAVKRHFGGYHLSGVREEYGAEVTVAGEVWESEAAQFGALIKDISKGKTEVRFLPCT